MAIRTDLTLETVNRGKLSEGITRTERGETFRVTEIFIESDAAGKSAGKRKGRYVTLEGKALSRFSEDYEEMVHELAEELRGLVPEEGAVLVVGLGNNDITPDALGPKAACRVLATRHLFRELEKEDYPEGLREVSVSFTGVLGQTGVETAEAVRALAEKIKPSAIIVIDALACSEVSRLGATIQLCNTGISPGSGVQNSRKELSDITMGVPVIAVGVPTVVDMHTIAENITGREPQENLPNMMVTPKDVDKLIENCSRLVANAVNLALHEGMSIAEAELLTS